MKRSVKEGLERFLLRAGPASIARRACRGRGLVLAYHNVVPDGAPVSGDLSLHLSSELFRRQLDTLLDSNLQVVSLDELIDDRHRPAADGPGRVAITFDDAYRGAVECGVAELARRDLPATIFVPPGLLEDHSFWWDVLSDGEEGLAADVRAVALRNLRGRNEEVIAWARREGMPVRTMPEFARTASESELRAASGRPGISLGSHTWSHPNLLRLAEREVRTELDRAADWLLRHFGSEAHWLSYPYGLCDERTGRIAAGTADLRGAFRIEGGWLSRPAERSEPFLLPRLNVPARLSPDGFALRLAGLLCG